jgi:hypothetical protein
MLASVARQGRAFGRAPGALLAWLLISQEMSPSARAEDFGSTVVQLQPIWTRMENKMVSVTCLSRHQGRHRNPQTTTILPWT